MSLGWTSQVIHAIVELNEMSNFLQGHMSEWYFVFNSMQALDGLYKENMKQDKQQRLDGRKKRLSEMLLKETKEYEVRCKTSLTIWL